MGEVLIIKNNEIDSDIYRYAYQSYSQDTRNYYCSSGVNEKNVKEIKKEFKGNGMILFLTYQEIKDNDKLKKEILDIFIGDDVNIDDNNNIFYNMKIHLKNDFNSNAIQSIIEKIDLDLSEDYGHNQYVIMSNMESLYDELFERINARKNIKIGSGKVFAAIRFDKREQYGLSQKDEQSYRIYKSDKLGQKRSEFQRDRERVVNCKAFRRLVDKAQIFGSSKGDYYRTRMTHSLEVNQIAKAIASALELNLDLTEAIALGHDIGHTPFGHQGERTLHDILTGKLEVGIEGDWILKNRYFGGFKHNYQSARILAHLEEKYVEHMGLNVSVQVIDGVLKHTKMRDDVSLKDFLDKKYIECLHIDENNEEQICSSLEGQVVAVADEIAQRGHDMDDALTSGVMTIDEVIDRLEIPKCSGLRMMIKSELDSIEQYSRVYIDKKELQISRIVSSIISYFISDVIDNSQFNIKDRKSGDTQKPFYEDKIIGFSSDVKKVNDYLERVVKKKVICNSEVARADYNANVIVRTLFQKYYSNPRLLHEGTIHKIFVETLMHENELVANSAVNLADAKVELANDEIEQMTKMELLEEYIKPYLEDKNKQVPANQIIVFEKRKILVRAITDYIAGMTDGYALQEYERLK